MPGPKWAIGTKIQRKNPVSLAYEDIPGLRDITGPEETTDILDITSHSSPNDSEEVVPTVHRHGEVRAAMLFDGANAVHLALLNDKQTKRLGDWRMVMPNDEATQLDFQGYVTSLAYSFPVTGAIEQALVIRVTGALSLTA